MKMLQEGATVDDFSLLDQAGNTVTFSSLVENGPLVVYFYIKALTPG